jgi:hypothetical protein
MKLNSIFLLEYSPETKGPSSERLSDVKPLSLRTKARARASKDTSHVHLRYWHGKYTKKTTVMIEGRGEGD